LAIPAGESRKGIVTTERELTCFSFLKELFEKSGLPGEIGYKDTTSYFGVYINKPSWWVVRVVLESKVNWISFYFEEEVESLIPEGFIRLPGLAHASFRLQISNPEEVLLLEDLILASFRKRVQERIGEESKGL